MPTKCGKNSTEISLMFQGRKMYSTSNGGDGGVWSQYIHLSMDFKATNITINRQNTLKVIKHSQIPQ